MRARSTPCGERGRSLLSDPARSRAGTTSHLEQRRRRRWPSRSTTGTRTRPPIGTGGALRVPTFRTEHGATAIHRSRRPTPRATTAATSPTDNGTGLRPTEALRWNSRLSTGQTGAKHSMLGQCTDHSVVHVRGEGTIAWPQRLSETTSSGTDFDAADEHVVASDADQP
jgi:hypothetical protein